MVESGVPPGQYSRFRRWMRGLRAALAIGILLGLGWKILGDSSSVVDLSLKGSQGDLVGAVLLTLGGLLGLPLGFVILLRRASLYRPEQRWFYWRLWLQSYFYRYVPGKVMLLAERVRLGSMVGLGPALSLVLLLWESVLLMAGASLLALMAFGLGKGSSPETLPYLEGTAAAAVVVLLAFPWGVAKLRRFGWFRERLGELEKIRLGYGDQLVLTAYYALDWGALGTGFFFFCRCFVPLGTEYLPRVVFAFVTGYVGGQVTGFIPGGVGVREGVMVLGLSGIVEPAQAVALAIAERLWMTAFELLSVALAARLVRLPAKQAVIQPALPGPAPEDTGTAGVELVSLRRQGCGPAIQGPGDQ